MFRTCKSEEICCVSGTEKNSSTSGFIFGNTSARRVIGEGENFQSSFSVVVEHDFHLFGFDRFVLLFGLRAALDRRHAAVQKCNERSVIFRIGVGWPIVCVTYRDELELRNSARHR